MIGASNRIDSLKVFTVAFAVAAQDDHDCAGVVPRAPEPVVLVIAYRFWQSIPGPEEVYCSGLTVAVGKDGSLFPLVRWEAVINLGYRARHLLPTKLISEVLRERPSLLVFCF